MYGVVLGVTYESALDISYIDIFLLFETTVTWAYHRAVSPSKKQPKNFFFENPSIEPVLKERGKPWKYI